LITFSCNCRERDFNEEIKNSNLIFVGKVINLSIIKIDPKNKLEFNVPLYYKKVEFLIEKIYKGKRKCETIIIYTGLGNGDCGFNFIINTSYIVYCDKKNKDFNSNVFDKVRNFYYTSICNRTCLFNSSEEKLLNEKFFN